MGKIELTVNGEKHSVGDNEVTSDVMLVDYLRQHLGLHGTKFMCREASCGACIVSITQPDGTPMSVNSCMISIPQCDGWSIKTIEKVGNRKDGYHPIQKSMAEHHGTQCGHCTPGWVMAMYSLAQSKKELTKLEIENSFASNICRCTGYRPIMDSLKRFAVDAENSQITDIEDLYVCKKTKKPCEKSCHSEEDWCFVSNPSVSEEEPIEIELIDGKKWYKVTEIKQAFDILRAEGDDNYMLVGGNTAKGAFPIDEYPRILIDISKIPELKGHSIDQNLTVGAGTTHTEILDIFQSFSKEDNFEYLQKFYDHIDLVANIPVRNVATIAGNLMTKHKHNMFPSDIFLLMTTVNSRLTIMDSQGTKEIVSMEEFLNMEMRGKIIYNLLFPPLNPSDHRFSSYKAMPRAQNAHAMVNIGFLCKLSSDSIVENACIVFGGLAPSFVRATEAEEHLKGKALFKNDTLQSTLKILKSEIVVEDDPPEKSPEYRKQLALGLFYKVMLAVCPEDQIGRRYRSAPTNLYKSRPVSKATQDFSTDPELYPLNQPIPKVEAMDQCAGEAKYSNDVPALPYEVFSALVLTTVGQGNIESIDASEALKMPGVIAFYSAKDIPGENSFTLLGVIVFVKKEEVFCSGKVAYYNQPLGIIIATSTALAERAAKRVKVIYANVKKPTIDIKETRKDESRTKLFLPIPNIGRGILVHKKFESNYTIHTQLHFCMELITCLSIPSEQGLEVHASTQWMDSVQYTIAKALNIDMNRVDVFTRRVGGAFGLKISRSSLGSVACSLAAFKLNRPVRLIQSFSSTARSLGKRFPCSTDVKVQVSRSGLIQYIDYDLFEDHGHIVSELVAIFGLDSHYNCYKRLFWNYKIYDSTTDTPSNTYCRAPGTLENIAMAETIMEQISYELELDPYDVRMTNLNTILHRDIKEMGEELKKKAEYDRRKKEVEEFNAANRWKKRGLRWAFMKYTPLGSAGFEVSLSVHHGDGSVSINHAGIELGQGINTKAIQICAHFLKIPVDKIKVKPQNTTTSPNSVLTAGSITSQSIGQGVEKCCLELLLRLAPVRLLLLFPSWEELIRKAHNLKIDLQTRHYVNDIISPIFLVYGVTLSEVEVDILTGESQVRRVDLYEDVGRSVSPQIDVGQVEGAFIMGMSYWMFEDLVYDKNTGEIKSDRPWNYHVAQCKDSPQDFRVSFRKNSYSGPIVLGAKVTGEPATCMAISVPLAIRQAIHSALKDSLGSSAPAWFPIEGPHTTEKVCMTAGTEIEQFVFN